MAIAANPLRLAPLLLGLLLLAVVVAESLGGARPPRLARAERIALASPPPAAAHALDAVAEARTIVARPLFSTSRRPAATPGAGPTTTVAPRLSAIFIGGAEKRCVFDDDGHPLVAREGGHAGPYTVIAIGADRVTVADAGGTRVLRPTALPADANTAATPAAPGPQPSPALQNLLARLRGLRGAAP
jgi:hypothetical protein